MGFKLAELFVEFTAKNAESVQKAVGGIETQMEKLTEAIDDLDRTMLQTMDAMETRVTSVQAPVAHTSSSFTGLGRLITTAITAASASIAGMATAGLAMSATGQMMQFRMERLALTVGGLFRPEIMKVIDLIGKLTTWITNLSDSQKQNISKWVEIAGAAIVLARVFNPVLAILAAITGVTAFQNDEGGMSETFKKLGDAANRLLEALTPVADMIASAVTPVIIALADAISSLSTGTLEMVVKWGMAIFVFSKVLTIATAVITAIKAMTVALWAENAALAVKAALTGNWVSIAAAVVAATAAVGAYYAVDAALSSAKDKKDKKKKDQGALPMQLGGPEGVGDTYNRIAQASRMVGGAKPTDEQQLEELQKLNASQEKTNQILGGAKPIVNKG